MTPVRLEGFALHAGTRTAVTLARHDGPITFGRGDERASLAQLCITRTDLGVAVSNGAGFEVDLVEHLLAALGGLGLRRGVLALVEGPEIPILDGGARAFVDALIRLEIPKEPPELRVVAHSRIEVGSSSYDFEPGESVDLTVEVSFDHPAIGARTARWLGDPRSFRDQIAPARTFGFAKQAALLSGRQRAGLASRVAGSADPATAALRNAVIVFDDPSTPPQLREENEIANHKLLDLVGDFAFHGGPPLGRVLARRPGHTATHEAIRQAIASGVLSRR